MPHPSRSLGFIAGVVLAALVTVLAPPNASAACSSDATTLCLQGGRYSAAVSWRNASTGAAGVGNAIPWSDDGGFFWFFDADNAEVAVKVLDGTTVNGYFWVFHGALTSMEYTLTVTDTATGTAKVYTKPASSECGAADTTAFPGSGTQATARTAVTSASAVAANTTCPPGAVCLNGGRFAVEVRRDGAQQSGSAVTPASGVFTFFNPATPEVVVKVLDGRATNGHYWVFFGSLTNQAYEVVVTDTATGFSRTYANLPAMCGRYDTAAFRDNQAPVTATDSASTVEDVAVTIDVLANDSDPDGDALTLPASGAIATAPAHGSATPVSATSIRYTPAAGFAGSDSFTYRVEDGWGGSATATVNVTVAAAPDPPRITGPDRLIVRHGKITTVTVTGVNFAGGRVSVEKAGGAAGRVYPTAQLSTMNAAGTSLTARIDATAAGIDGFYTFAVITPAGVAVLPFRVVGAAPVVDFHTPSQAVAGNTYVVQIGGANLLSADLVPGVAGVEVLYLDNSNDDELIGLIHVKRGTPPSSGTLIVRNGAGDRPVPLEIDTTVERRTEMLVSGESSVGSGGRRPAIFLQVAVMTAETEAQVAASQTSGFEFCLKIQWRWSRRVEGTIVLFYDKLTGDPVVRTIISTLRPGESLLLGMYVLRYQAEVTVEITFRVCLESATDASFCFSAYLGVEIPGVQAFEVFFTSCHGESYILRVEANGLLFNFTWSNSNGCLSGRDPDPPSTLGERDVEVKAEKCCSNADLRLSMSGTALSRDFQITNLPVILDAPMNCDPNYTLKFATFIPFNHVEAPYDPEIDPPFLCKLYARGDDRSFDPAASIDDSRVTQFVWAAKGQAMTMAGFSEEYAENALADGRITDADRDAILDDCHLLHDEGRAKLNSGTNNVTKNATVQNVYEYRFAGSAPYPLFALSFPISWELTVRIDARQTPTLFTITGLHDCFPAMEIYFQDMPLYRHMPPRSDITYLTNCLAGTGRIRPAGCENRIAGQEICGGVSQFNSAPVASNDSAETVAPSGVTVQVLANDSDPDGDAVKVTAVGAPRNGTAALNTDSSITYVPASSFSGSDSFTYTVSDGDMQGTATVSVSVKPANVAPSAAADAVTTQQNTATRVAVLANDKDANGDVLRIVSLTQPLHGTTALNADKTITYTPRGEFAGLDSFRYTIADPAGLKSTATVTMTTDIATGDSAVAYGNPGDIPVVGDWNGDGIDDLGVYRSNTFYLAGVAAYVFGQYGDQPVAGDWDGNGKDEIGVFRSGVFYLRSSHTSSATVATFSFGDAGGRPIAGDWDGDGKDEVGTFYYGTVRLRGNAVYAGATYTFGPGNGKPIAGDWDGDGKDDVGLSYYGVYHLRRTDVYGGKILVPYGDHAYTPIAGRWSRTFSDSIGYHRSNVFTRRLGPAGGYLSIAHGLSSDKAVTGDWNGDGKSEIGVWRSGTFYLAGVPAFAFGPTNSSSMPVAGDWDGDGKDQVGVFLYGTFYLRGANGSPDQTFAYGATQDRALAGDWDGDGRDDVGVYQWSGTFYLRGPGGGGFTFGTGSGTPVAGDWDGDGKDDVGVFDAGTFSLRGNARWPGRSFQFGTETDEAVAGDWLGAGADGVGTVNGNVFNLKVSARGN